MALVPPNLEEAIVDLDVGATTLISDRDKGLQATDDELRHAMRTFCTQHIAASVQAKFGIEPRRKFDAATRNPCSHRGVVG